MNTNRKRSLEPECRALHATLRANLRRRMDAFHETGREGTGIGIIRLARKAGIGVGSVQSILGDPEHSPSLRVLDHLARVFDVTVAELLDQRGGGHDA